MARFDWKKIQRWVIGAPRDPLRREQREGMLLVAFLAWIGLGADGLSSANYGPEETFLALGAHSHLALYLALATALTVVIICLGYVQVIELFPSGGGGYRVASVLVGRYAGLVSGSALIVNFILTAAISVASGVDALFSLLPVFWQPWKVPCELVIIVLLTIANLRGVKEVLMILMPIFIGFLLTHGGLIIAGVVGHAGTLPSLVPDTFAETGALAGQIGWAAVLGVVLQAFALGGGTYTGIEAVSNNIHMLREPRTVTGRWTMTYMAASLSFAACGLIVLYLLWHIRPEIGRTLNAVTFRSVLTYYLGSDSLAASLIMLATLSVAAGLLFVASNTGFLGGPAALANMAIDRWMPHQFAHLSNRLVTQNGVLLMAGAAIAVLLVTEGRVDKLVVLYSINVFISFVLSFVGLSRHWLRRRDGGPLRPFRLFVALFGLILTSTILAVTTVNKFLEGAWMTVVITGCVIITGLLIRRHYDMCNKLLSQADALFATTTRATAVPDPPPLKPEKPTAVFLVGGSLGTGMHTLLATRKLFPDHFANYVFIRVGEVDSDTFRHAGELETLRQRVDESLAQFVNYCRRRRLAATAFGGVAADAAAELTEILDQVLAKFPSSMVFASQLVFKNESFWTRLLHGQTPLIMQRRLQARGIPMLILPMKL
jgi:amino acid transporter